MQLIPNKQICIYCGQPSDTKDLFIPESYAEEYNLENYEIETCYECMNLSRGGIFDSVDEKINFIQSQIRFKYKNLLGTNEDLLSWEEIERKSNLKLRLGWRNWNNPNYAQLAKINSSLRANGKNSAPVNAAIATTKSSVKPRFHIGENNQQNEIYPVKYRYMIELNGMALTQNDLDVFRMIERKHGTREALNFLMETRPRKESPSCKP